VEETNGDLARAVWSESKEYLKQLGQTYQNIGQRKPYNPSTMWEHNITDWMLPTINENVDAVGAYQTIQRYFSPTIGADRPILQRAVEWHLELLRGSGVDLFEMPSPLQESKFAVPASFVEMEGRRLSPSLFWYLNYALDIGRYCRALDRKGPRILELGGGLGHFARIAKILYDCQHVIIDLPETLIFSYAFLRLNFPDSRFTLVRRQGQLTRADLEQSDFVFVPILFAEDVLGVGYDLFVNTMSLGEMTNTAIQYWMEFVQRRLDVKYLFTFNRYLNPINPKSIIPGVSDRLNENQGSVLYEQDWEIVNWELLPRYTRCPYMDTHNPNYLEIVAERRHQVDIRARSQQLLSEATGEDWARDTSPYANGIIAFDTTMGGTLFKLWESVRLDPNESNVAAMLKYLGVLEQGRKLGFEETSYYKKLLEVLRTDSAPRSTLELAKLVTSPFENPFSVRTFRSFYRVYKWFERKRFGAPFCWVMRVAWKAKSAL